MIRDFKGRRPLPVRYHMVSIKDRPCVTELDRLKVGAKNHFFLSNFATQGVARILTFILQLVSSIYSRFTTTVLNRNRQRSAAHE